METGCLCLWAGSPDHDRSGTGPGHHGREEKVSKAQTAVFIQCVGSREPERPYCSKVCCTHSVESALTLKKINPEMDIFILYRDMRTFGVREDLYREARNQGIFFIRFDLENKPEVQVRRNRR